MRGCDPCDIQLTRCRQCSSNNFTDLYFFLSFLASCRVSSHCPFSCLFISYCSPSIISTSNSTLTFFFYLLHDLLHVVFTTFLFLRLISSVPDYSILLPLTQVFLTFSSSHSLLHVLCLLHLFSFRLYPNISPFFPPFSFSFYFLIFALPSSISSSSSRCLFQFASFFICHSV